MYVPFFWQFVALKPQTLLWKLNFACRIIHAFGVCKREKVPKERWRVSCVACFLMSYFLTHSWEEGSNICIHVCCCNTDNSSSLSDNYQYAESLTEINLLVNISAPAPPEHEDSSVLGLYKCVQKGIKYRLTEHYLATLLPLFPQLPSLLTVCFWDFLSVGKEKCVGHVVTAEMRISNSWETRVKFLCMLAKKCKATGQTTE